MSDRNRSVIDAACVVQPGHQIMRQERTVDRCAQEPLLARSVLNSPVEAREQSRQRALAGRKRVGEDWYSGRMERCRIFIAAEQEALALRCKACDDPIEQSTPGDLAETFVASTHPR